VLRAKALLRSALGGALLLVSCTSGADTDRVALLVLASLALAQPLGNIGDPSHAAHDNGEGPSPPRDTPAIA
jgi:hypothetical protein